MSTPYTQKSDRDLVLACQRREPQAFEELVKRLNKEILTDSFRQRFEDDMTEEIEKSREHHV